MLEDKGPPAATRKSIRINLYEPSHRKHIVDPNPKHILRGYTVVTLNNADATAENERSCKFATFTIDKINKSREVKGEFAMTR